MMGVLVCPCGERMRVDLVREFTQVRCDCGLILDRTKNLSDEEVVVTKLQRETV